MEAPDRAGQGTGAVDDEWYRRGPREALEAFGVERAGLDEGEARRRLREHGPNRIREQEEVSAWRVLLGQLTDPLVYVLLAALVATLAIRSFADAIVIGAVLVINTTIGFFQEFRAESAVRSLMEMVSPRARVRRGGEVRRVDAQDLVPGDVVLLEQGGVVPADLRLLEVTGLQVAEAALTGESVPVDKHPDALVDAEEHLPPGDQTCMAFMGTDVTSGEGEGVVVATGPATEIGRIAEQVQEAERVETPLEQRMHRLARWIAIAILGVAVLASVVGLLLGYDVDEMLLLAVALAVAAIPAGLPVVVTVALAVGVRRMARRHAVIRSLPAVDTLGSCTVIVSDKTGTLTRNRMTVRTVAAAGRRFRIAGDELDAEGVTADDGSPVEVAEIPGLRETILAGVLCNDAQEGDDDASGDPMEVALLAVGRVAGMTRADLRQRYPLRDKVPFRTEQQFMATIHDDPESRDGPLVLVKGAPERVVELCDRARTAAGEDEPIDPDAVMQRSEELAEQGLRVLAMAVGHGEDAAGAVKDGVAGELVLVGLQGLLDPPRDSAVEAVDRCHEAGIRVVMVTGDHATTAAAIGRAVHVGRPGAGAGTDASQDALETRRGPELADLDDDELDAVLARVDVFARVAPGQKLRLVERLQARGEVVAVTGDGVNDAPALQTAHIGAAMGSGTDVAKEASDMVVTDDNFASVYAAVEEGRTAFRNIRMATFFLLSTGAADILIILAALGLRWPLPLLPAQILWINVVTNGIADVALAFEPGERALFRRPPRPVDEGVLHRGLIERLALVGVWLSAGTLGVFWWQWEATGDLEFARTAAVTTMVLFQKVHVFNSRSEDLSLFAKSPLENKVLFLGVLASLAVHVAALYLPPTQQLLRFAPLDLATWAAAAAVASTAIVVNELHKRLRASHWREAAR